MKQNFFVLKKTMYLLFIIILNVNIFSYVCSNGAGVGFEGGEEGGIQEIGEKTIEMYITEGAGYYLGATSDINSILKIFELQNNDGVDFDRFYRLVDNALNSMNQSVSTYEILIEKAEKTPYNQIVLNKLAIFDYHSFSLENRLNQDIFKVAESYLQHGRIIDVFKHTYANFLVIKGILTSIKSDIALKQVPELTVMWNLNELCLETLFFGSYVARIFHEVL